MQHGVFELIDTTDCGIAGLTLAHGQDRSLLNVLRGVEIGLTHAKIDDLCSLLLQGLGFGIDGQGCRWLDSRHPLRQFHHQSFFLDHSPVSPSYRTETRYKSMGRSGHACLASILAGKNTRKIFRSKLTFSHLHQGADKVSHHVPQKTIRLKQEDQMVRIRGFERGPIRCVAPWRSPMNLQP